MSRFDRDTVVAELRAEDVAAHLGIKGQWRGRWMRTNRCAEADHGSDAFALARDGMWHCHACDTGGDLLSLIARGERMDLSGDFPRVLEVAAAIAGVAPDDDFGPAPRPAPKARPAPPPLKPWSERLRLATRRAAWVWDHLYEGEILVAPYLRTRGLDPAAVLRREEIRCTPLRGPRPTAQDSEDLRRLWATMAHMAIAIPVRDVTRGAFTDIRVRRMEPSPGQPKIIGMLGGVTVQPETGGWPAQLAGCYGHPEEIDGDSVVLVEGAMDYLTGLQIFQSAQVLGATSAGDMPLLAAHAARKLAARDDESVLIIIEQNDPPRRARDGRALVGAADVSVNELPNSAAKTALRHLGPHRVKRILCRVDGRDDIKDLNDLLCAGVDVRVKVESFSAPEPQDG